VKRFVYGAIIAVISVFCAAAQDAGVIEQLRKENRELRTKLLEQSARLRRLELWLGDVATGDGKLDQREREAVLLRRLQEVSAGGRELALKVDNTSMALRRTVAELPVSSARKTQLILRLEELELMARRHIALLSRSDRQYESHVISFDRNIGVAVISGGIGKGFFPGMIFRDKSGKSKLRLRVIGVRPAVAAAEVIDGAWDDLTPGMALTALTERHSR
jgi:hypothetical protein